MVKAIVWAFDGQLTCFISPCVSLKYSVNFILLVKNAPSGICTTLPLIRKKVNLAFFPFNLRARIIFCWKFPRARVATLTSLLRQKLLVFLGKTNSLKFGKKLPPPFVRLVGGVRDSRISRHIRRRWPGHQSDGLRLRQRPWRWWCRVSVFSWRVLLFAVDVLLCTIGKTLPTYISSHIDNKSQFLIDPTSLHVR